MRKKLLALMLVLLASTLPSHAEPSSTIKMQPLQHHILVLHATIRGHAGTFLFDSGGGVSNLTPEFASLVGCRAWGRITGFRMTGQRLEMLRCDNVGFQISGNDLPPRTVGVFDINKFMPPGTVHLDGTISLDVFAGRKIGFSYSSRTLTLLDESSFARLTKGRKAMPIYLVRDAEGLALTVNLPVQTPDGLAWFEMDSGNGSGNLVVAKYLARLLKLDPDSKTSQTLEVSLADGTKMSGNAVVLGLILDGNLGTTFLSDYDVTLDLVHARAWLSPAQSQRP